MAGLHLNWFTKTALCLSRNGLGRCGQFSAVSAQ
jgi:hypothetical protein